MHVTRFLIIKKKIIRVNRKNIKHATYWKSGQFDNAWGKVEIIEAVYGYFQGNNWYFLVGQYYC